MLAREEAARGPRGARGRARGSEEELGAPRERERAPRGERRLRGLHGRVDLLDASRSRRRPSARPSPGCTPGRCGPTRPRTRWPPIQWLIGLTAAGASIDSVMVCLLECRVEPSAVASRRCRRLLSSPRSRGSDLPAAPPTRRRRRDGYCVTSPALRLGRSGIRLERERRARSRSARSAARAARATSSGGSAVGSTPADLAERLLALGSCPTTSRADEHDVARPSLPASRRSRCAASRPSSDYLDALEVDWEVWTTPGGRAAEAPRDRGRSAWPLIVADGTRRASGSRTSTASRSASAARSSCAGGVACCRRRGAAGGARPRRLPRARPRALATRPSQRGTPLPRRRRRGPMSAPILERLGFERHRRRSALLRDRL